MGIWSVDDRPLMKDTTIRSTMLTPKDTWFAGFLIFYRHNCIHFVAKGFTHLILLYY